MLRRLYDWMIAKGASPQAPWWLALFAFVEASFFPVPPHPLLGIMCYARPKRAIGYAAIATVASVLGGLLGYAIGHFLFDALGVSLLRVLHLEHSFPKAACHLRSEYGFWIIIGKGATPIPFKLITITAGFIAMPLATFFAASVISRSISFMIVGLLFRLFGAPIKTFIDRYLGLVTIGFVVVVVAGFLAVSLLDGGGGGHDACDAMTTLPAR